MPHRTTTRSIVACTTLDLRSVAARDLALAHDIDATSPPLGRPAIQWQGRMARALLLDLLAGAVGPGSWTLSADSRGKPMAQGSPGMPAVEVSLSHSTDIAAAAVSTIGPVGVDVEAHRRDRDVARIAGYAFGPAERERIAAGGGDDFYRTWTLREAMGKATGDGLTFAADGCDHTAAMPYEGTWVQDDGAWLLAHRRLRTTHSLALAIRPAAPTPWTADSIAWRDLI